MPLRPPPHAALLLVVAMAPMALSPEAVAGPQMRATVLSIGNGDTIRLLQDQQQLTIRLACFYGPEMAQVRDSNIAQAFPEVLAAVLRFDHQAPRLRSGFPPQSRKWSVT